MKYIAVVIVLTVGVLLNSLGILAPRLPFAHAKPIQVVRHSGIQGRGCNDKFVRTYGFPFRVNKYDECEKNESLHVVALAVNVAFWALVGYAVLKYTSSRYPLHHK